MARRRRVALAGLGMVTKKDFQAVADILCNEGASKKMAGAFASYFARQNPRFSSERFVSAVLKCKKGRR